MRYPVLLLPWPLHGAEPRLIEWTDYIEDPSVGLIVDPNTGQPYPGLVSVRVELLDCPAGSTLEAADIGEQITIPLIEYLTLESRRRDLGRLPWARLLQYVVEERPPAHPTQGTRDVSEAELRKAQDFLLEALADGPMPKERVLAHAAEQGISSNAVLVVKDRLRIASARDQNTEHPQTFWRLRMAQSYILQKKKLRAPD